jgi:hypothetical protein
MSRKHFSLLLGLTLAVTLLVLLVPGKTGKESEFRKSRLLPDMQEQVNDLAWLRFTGAGGATIATLRRGDDGWVVEESDDYRADWERLRALLADLTQAEIVEAKTANADYYDRLGVEDIDLPDAGGTQIGFAEASGLPALIVGKRAEGRNGQYVRLRGTAESALIDRPLDLPAAASDWLEKQIVDVADSEVVEIEIGHPDGERVVATRASADDENFELQDIPEGREIRSAWTVNSLANALSSLTLEAVAGDGAIDWTDAVRFGLVTADGLRIDVELAVRAADGANGETEEGPDGEVDDGLADSEGEYWIRLQAGLHQTAVGSGVGIEEEPAGGKSTVDGAAEEELVEDAAADDAAARARAINQRVTGWAYRIPQYKFDSMNKRLEDLLLAAGDSES